MPVTPAAVRTAATAALMVCLLLASMPALAAEHRRVIDVDTVDELYEAAPTDGVTISVAAGVYPLEPDRPDGGRLVLGDRTALVSSLELEVDDRGVPTGGVVTPGAVIDTSAVTAPVPIDVGVVVLGARGRLSGLTVTRNPAGPVIAIDVPSGGTVDHVIAEQHFFGVRIRAGARSVRARLRQSVVRDNLANGVTIAQPAADPLIGSQRSRLRARIDRNRIEGATGVSVLGAVSGGDRNRTIVTTTGNTIDTTVYGIALVGALVIDEDADGSERNAVLATSRDDRISGTEESAVSVDGVDKVVPAAASSNANRATLRLIDTRFAANANEIEALGSFSDVGEDPVGVDNRAKVIVANSDPPFGDLRIRSAGCFPLSVDPCQNEATVIPR